ncbi:MAG: hypothetical protein ACI97K_000989 [Glaciecola sp.]|jgi:hypothetical protein
MTTEIDFAEANESLVERSELVPFELVDELAEIAKVDIENKILHDMVNGLERFDYETTKKLMERMP